jgi:hypothetical protein
MKFYFIEPEVAGGLGENTVMGSSIHPPSVNKLHYHFDGWLGDVLLESFPCFIVTDCAKQKLQEAEFTGSIFDEVEVTTSEQFQALHSHQQLPKFVWLKIHGIPGQDDFGIASDGRLVISERAYLVFQKLGIDQAFVTEYLG